MADNVAVEFCGSYIHVKQSGVFELAHPQTRSFWGRLKEICDELDSDTVLIEANSMDISSDMMSAFDSGVSAADIVSNPTIAICSKDYEPDDMSEFFKTVAINRGAQVEFFTDVRNAVDWLGIDTAPSKDKSGAAAV